MFNDTVNGGIRSRLYGTIRRRGWYVREEGTRWGKIEINSFVFSSYERIERVVREPRNRMEIRVLN